MKNKIFLALVLASIIGLYAFNTPSLNDKQNPALENLALGVQFHKGTWAEALAKAKQENKLIFLDIYATWCGSCKKLKKYTFTNTKVGTYFNANFINVTLDGEEGEGAILSSKFNMSSYPTLFFINSDGKIIKQEVGYLTANELVRFGKSVKK
jgi:thioredoxin 1